MFNTIIRRAVVVTAGAGFALTLFAAPASAAPRPDGGEWSAGRSEQAHSAQQERDGSDDTSQMNPQPKGNPSDEKLECSDTHHSDTGHGANQGSTYDNTCEAEHEPGNGSETGEAKGQPCAGCVGNADDKNPAGQEPDHSGRSGVGGDDSNNGYECDGNQGIAQENPAHTSCQPSPEPEVTVEEKPVVKPKTDEKPQPVCGEAPMTTDVNGDKVIDEKDCDKPEAPVAPADGVRCGEVMAEDVNGDGKINAADCTKVLGVVFERPGEAPKVLATDATADAGTKVGTPAEVKGIQFNRTGPLSLSRTGAMVMPMAVAAIVMIAAGVVLVNARRRSA